MILSLLLAGMGTAATAQNINLPIIQTKYTADPAPYVHNDTVYLYTTHDEDGAEGFLMKDWLLYTSTDMVNWQDRGAVASYLYNTNHSRPHSMPFRNARTSSLQLR